MATYVPRHLSYARSVVRPVVASLLLGAGAGLVGGCASHPAARPPEAPTTAAVPTQIIAARTDGTPRELFTRGEAALIGQRWQDAVDSFEALLAGDPNGPMTPAALFDLAMAHVGLGQREQARDRYHELVARFPGDPNARNALVSACELHAYLEEWQPLIDTAVSLLARNDIDDVDRMTALGARGLGEIELGQVEPAARDIEEGLDVVERNHYGAENRLPVPAAQLRFALGELRRARSELISLDPPGPDFLAKMDARCALLLSAQGAYADAIRSVDPHWAEMSGYRVGDMYRRLHHDLMQIPPVSAAKTERDRQLHFGMMHVRYRVLLQKGIDMMDRTLALAEKTGDTSAWVKRTRDARQEMTLALEDEKAQIAGLPFTEEELEKALDILKAKTLKKAADAEAAAAGGPKKAAAKP